MKRFRRAKPKAGACVACGRVKNDRKRPLCPRCPGRPIAASLALEPLLGVRIVSGDPSMTMSAISVTSPTQPGRLEVCRDIEALAPELDDVMSDAIARSEDDGAPIWLVLEDPGMGGDRATPAMMLSVGQAIGCFRRAWALAGGRDSRVVLVRQITWQAGLMPGQGTQDGRDDRVAASLDLAPLVWGQNVTSGGAISWTADAAASALLAHFLLRWPEFLDAVGPMDRKRAAEVVARAARAERQAAQPLPTAPRITPAPPIAAPAPAAPHVARQAARQRSLFG